MRRGEGKKVFHFFGLAIGLFLAWILLSGKFETKFIVIGIFASLAISYVCLPFLVIKNPHSGKSYFVFGINYPKFILYGAWLMWEIFKASLAVTAEVLKPHMDYEPRVVHFKMAYQNPLASVILANSIILTPGTITLDVTEDGIFEVHALTEAAADDLLGGEMARRVAVLFGETCEFEALRELIVTDIPKEVEYDA